MKKPCFLFHFKKESGDNNSLLTPVPAKGTSCGWMSSEGEDIRKHALAVFETSGRSPIAGTKPCGLSFKIKLRCIC